MSGKEILNESVQIFADFSGRFDLNYTVLRAGLSGLVLQAL